MKRKQCTELCIKFPSVNASCTFKTSHCVLFKYKVKHGLGVVRPGTIVKMCGGGGLLLTISVFKEYLYIKYKNIFMRYYIKKSCK